VAPFVGAGLRFWLGSYVTLGAGVRVSVVATRDYVMNSSTLDRGAVSLSAGLELGFHL
jgi:hypothetical protein